MASIIDWKDTHPADNYEAVRAIGFATLDRTTGRSAPDQPSTPEMAECSRLLHARKLVTMEHYVDPFGQQRFHIRESEELHAIRERMKFE